MPKGKHDRKLPYGPASNTAFRLYSIDLERLKWLAKRFGGKHKSTGVAVRVAIERMYEAETKPKFEFPVDGEF